MSFWQRGFLEQTVAFGQTNPQAAIELAFRQRPDVIYLLTDGEFPDNQAVVDLIRRLNPDKAVEVRSIAFVNRGEEYERVLMRIAEDNRGAFKYVGEEDMRR